jgi:hypothetical protein
MTAVRKTHQNNTYPIGGVTSFADIFVQANFFVCSPNGVSPGLQEKEGVKL